MSKRAIINTADKVWLYLGKNGKTALDNLPDKVKTKPKLVHEAIGWLACENRIQFVMRAKTVYVSLSTRELNTYQRNNIIPPCCG